MKIIVFELDKEIGRVEDSGEQLVLSGDSAFKQFIFGLYTKKVSASEFVANLPNRLRSRISAVEDKER